MTTYSNQAKNTAVVANLGKQITGNVLTVLFNQFGITFNRTSGNFNQFGGSNPTNFTDLAKNSSSFSNQSKN